MFTDVTENRNHLPLRLPH